MARRGDADRGEEGTDLTMVPTAAVFDAYLQFLLFPLNNPGFLPTLMPLAIGLFVIEVYFARWHDEELGWNSAVSNSTLIITTALTLIYRLDITPDPLGPRTAVAYGILVLGLIYLVLNFYHLWPARVAFNVSSSFMVYTLVYLAIVVVHLGIPLTEAAFGGAVLAFGTIYVFFKALKDVHRSLGSTPKQRKPRRRRRRRVHREQ